jgi:hypothetical protein
VDKVCPPQTDDRMWRYHGRANLLSVATTDNHSGKGHFLPFTMNFWQEVTFGLNQLFIVNSWFW